MNATTTQYSTQLVGEVVGTGYTQGGQILTINQTPTSGSLGGTVAYWSFANVVWSPAAFTARGALIYNSSQNNASVFLLDFGADKTCANSFTVTMPAINSTNAIMRIA